MFTAEHGPIADRIYEDLVTKEGLYAYAYLGFHRPKHVSRKLNLLWAKAKRRAVKGKYNA